MHYRKRECLTLDKLDENPMLQFYKWFSEAKNNNVSKPNAAYLSTLSKNKYPHSRTIMIKAFDESGFIFFTDCSSDKVKQIKENNRIALLFSWLQTERQIIICGIATPLSIQEAFSYFSKRGDKMGCWIKDEGILDSRIILEKQLGDMLKKLYRKKIKYSEIFCGYRIIPQSIEFWQVCKDKLFQSFLYEKDSKGLWSLKKKDEA